MNKFFLGIFIFLFYSLPFGEGWGGAFAQELKCTIQVQNTSKSQTVDPKVYQTLKLTLTDFMNGKKWTEDVFENHERIECTFVINITEELGPDKFRAQATIQASRPVFKSTYDTRLINYLDKEFDFDYTQDQPLEFVENIHTSNLSSLMAYYAYLIIGLDYDSFSPLGGTPYFVKAQNIVSNAQNVPEPGWRSKKYTDTKNRYWIIENLLSSKFEKFRNAFYKYHRLGMDRMYDNVAEAKKTVTEALNDLATVNKENPTSITIQMFCDAKSEELIGIYSQGSQQEKNNAVLVLSALDPPNAQKYKRITK